MKIITILVDGIVFKHLPYGGVARIYRETLPRIADRNPRILFFVLCEESYADTIPVHSRIKPIFFSPWKYRPSRLYSIINSYRKWRFNRWLKNLSPDVFHATYYRGSPVPARKTVATVYDMVDHEIPFLLSNGPGFVAKQGDVLEHADWIMSISNSTADSAVRAFKLDPDKVTPIHLDASKAYRRLEEKIQDEFKNKYTNGHPFFLFVGGMTFYKNLPMIIRAMGKIRKTNDHVLLLASRSGGYPEQFIFDLMVNEEVEGRIIRLVAPNDELLCEAYNASDAFIFPSLYEGFGIPLVEAMRCGAPVLASDIPVFHEVCGNAALYFDPHDPSAIADVLMKIMDQNIQSEMTKLGEDRSKYFSWDDASGQLEDIYLDLVN